MGFLEHLHWLEQDALKSLQELKLSIIRAGVEVFDLSMINPDIPPAQILIDRLVEASMRPDCHRYAVSRGIRKLREAFTIKYRNSFGISLDPEHEVCVTMGAKDALIHLLMCLSQPGEWALVGKPTYPAHQAALRCTYMQWDYFSVGSNEDQMLEEICIKLRQRPFRVVILNFPNNPSGVSVSPEFYRELALVAERSGAFIVNDFVYGEMDYNNSAGVSLLAELQRNQKICEIYSLSKAYSVPGWRVGAILGNPALVKSVSRLKAHIDYGIFLPIQEAAVCALSSDKSLCQPIVAEYRERAETLTALLRKAGWQVSQSNSGASLWARAPKHFEQISSLSLAEQLLRKLGIMALPGSLFGSEYDNFLRFALVLPADRLQIVGERIRSLGSESSSELQLSRC